VETLKIDRSFLQGMLDDPEDLGIVESVVRLTQAFGRSVVAEGVETPEHFEMLTRLHCEVGQGFGIARPMPPEGLADWIVEWRGHRLWRQVAAGSVPRSAKDMVLKTAIESHRKWVDELADYLSAPEERTEPPLDTHECRFGLWYHGTGAIRYGHQDELIRLNPLHEQIYALAHRGRAEEAVARLPELRLLCDRLVARLLQLIEVLECP